MKKSIYEIIIENIQETGKLSDDFDLKKSLTGKTEYTFAPGALDGIHIYHFSISDEQIEKNKTTIKKAIDYANQEKIEKADKEFEKILEKDFRAIDVIDDIYSYIQYNSEKLNPKTIFEYGFSQLIKATNVELV